MAKCDLAIELEDPERIYRGGDQIRGTVVVWTDKAVNCSDLVVEANWETHGRGNVTKGEPNRESVFRGEWQPGEHRYDFQVELARWPPTYHGNYLNVDHYIRARAKIPWSFDPQDECASACRVE